MKFLLWAMVGIVIAMWLLRKNRHQVEAHTANRVPEEPKIAEAMVRCTQCGTYIPISEAVMAQSDKAYCSQEHCVQHAAN